MRNTHLLKILVAIALVSIVTACSTPRQPPMPVGDLKLGVAFFTQPQSTDDLFAGYMTERTDPIEQKVLGELDMHFSTMLGKLSNNTFVSTQISIDCAKSMGNKFTKRQAALRRWAALGRCMGVDLLVVPQIIEWRERDGGEYGVEKPAKVVMDIYVLNVNEESLISRSRYDETQSALTSNLLDTGKFFKRGAKWVTAIELADEGMEKAIKDLGL